MTIQYISLPLYSDADYQYEAAIEGNSYIVRIYYNGRCKQWMFDLYRDDNTSVVVGVALVPMYPTLLDYVTPNLTGFIYLEPVGGSVGKYRTDPENLQKYFRLFYLYNKEE